MGSNGWTALHGGSRARETMLCHTVLLLLALSAGVASIACSPGLYLHEEADECLTEEDCLAIGRSVREDGYCRAVYKVSTEAEFIRMAEHPYEAYILTQDITLTKPWARTKFEGELDGQGHRIRGINFDLRACYDATYSGGGERTVSVGLFSDIAILKNISLEAVVDIISTVDPISELYLGVVSARTTRPMLVYDVAINGRISVRQGSTSIKSAYMGGFFGTQMSDGAVIGPNVTSFIDFRCQVMGTCEVAGLARSTRGKIGGVAVYSNTVILQATTVAFGGITTDCQSRLVFGSFVEAGSITVLDRTEHVSISGLLSGDELYGAVQDCYSIIDSTEVQAGRISVEAAMMSPFIARSLTATTNPLTIERCYGWLKKTIGVASGAQVYVGGLIGYAERKRLTISSCFAIIGDVRVVSAGKTWIGGVLGYSKGRDYDSGNSLAVRDSWTRLRVSSLPMKDVVYLGGLCGNCSVYPAQLVVSGLSLDFTVSSAVAAGRGRYVGALAGYMEMANIMDSLLEYHCKGDSRECDSIRFLAEGRTVSIQDIYVAQEGGLVIHGAEAGNISSVTGKYDQASYPALQGWTFYESSYPTLSSLPVVDRTVRSTFADPEGSTWDKSTWIVPDADDNAPQLVGNPKCKGIKGEALCVSCPGGPWSLCTECERGSLPAESGLICEKREPLSRAEMLPES